MSEEKKQFIGMVPRAVLQVWLVRLGMVVTNARRTAFTDSAFLNTRATSGSSRTATAPGWVRSANRFGLALV